MLTAPIIELHNQKGYFLHHIIFACCTLICIICLLLLPESRDQNLPESIADGEHYTRQPLLPPRRGEQPLLLTNAELKDYSGLHTRPPRATGCQTAPRPTAAAHVAGRAGGRARDPAAAARTPAGLGGACV
nr:solute carrier family 22 member 23-like [Camelus dromedarius]